MPINNPYQDALTGLQTVTNRPLRGSAFEVPSQFTDPTQVGGGTLYPDPVVANYLTKDQQKSELEDRLAGELGAGPSPNVERLKFLLGKTQQDIAESPITAQRAQTEATTKANQAAIAAGFMGSGIFKKPSGDYTTASSPTGGSEQGPYQPMGQPSIDPQQAANVSARQLAAAPIQSKMGLEAAQADQARGMGEYYRQYGPAQELRAQAEIEKARAMAGGGPVVKAQLQKELNTLYDQYGKLPSAGGFGTKFGELMSTFGASSAQAPSQVRGALQGRIEELHKRLGLEPPDWKKINPLPAGGVSVDQVAPPSDTDLSVPFGLPAGAVNPELRKSVVQYLQGQGVTPTEANIQHAISQLQQP